MSSPVFLILLIGHVIIYCATILKRRIPVVGPSPHPCWRPWDNVEIFRSEKLFALSQQFSLSLLCFSYSYLYLQLSYRIVSYRIVSYRIDLYHTAAMLSLGKIKSFVFARLASHWIRVWPRLAVWKTKLFISPTLNVHGRRMITVYCIVLYCIVLYCIVLYGIVLYCIITYTSFALP